MTNPLPHQHTLLALFYYDPETGTLTWKERTDMTGQWNGRWAGTEAGSTKRGDYASASINDRPYQAHRIIWVMVHGSIPDGMQIDHINGDKQDNRLCNLRLATQSQNQQNRLAVSGRDLPKGIYQNQHGKYRAECSFHGVRIATSSIDDLDKITAIQQELEVRLHGEFAGSLNRKEKVA